MTNHNPILSTLYSHRKCAKYKNTSSHVHPVFAIFSSFHTIYFFTDHLDTWFGFIFKRVRINISEKKSV